MRFGYYYKNGRFVIYYMNPRHKIMRSKMMPLGWSIDMLQKYIALSYGEKKKGFNRYQDAIKFLLSQRKASLESLLVMVKLGGI